MTKIATKRKTFGLFGRRTKPDIDPVALGEASKTLTTATEASKDAKKEFEEAEKSLGIADEKFKQENINLVKNTADVEQLVKTKKGQEALQKQKMDVMKANIANLETDIKKAAVSTKLDSLGRSIEDAKLKLAVLENTYNQGLIGDFVRVKLEGMMSDPQFCQATKACPENATPTSDFKPNLKGLFESTDRDRKKESESPHKAP